MCRARPSSKRTSAGAILGHASLRRVLDLDRPLGLSITAVLHYILDDEVAYGATRTLVDALAPGSYVAISHSSFNAGSQDVVDRAAGAYGPAASLKVRTRPQIARFFEGLEMAEPGLVRAPLWCPEAPDDLFLGEPERYLGFVGVGRKP